MYSTCVFAGMWGEKHYFCKCDLMVACIREKMVLLKIEILRPCAETSKSESWSEAWKPLFLTSSSADSFVCVCVCNKVLLKYKGDRESF